MDIKEGRVRHSGVTTGLKRVEVCEVSDGVLCPTGRFVDALDLTSANKQCTLSLIEGEHWVIEAIEE
jgi:hypothetical protein